MIRRNLFKKGANYIKHLKQTLPLFTQQIAAGGPVTVTDEAVSRYFMTTREAVELVLQACVLQDSDSGARGKIYVLDMGDPVRIIDLAHQMIRLAGLRPGKDIDIDIIGLREGEKLHEEPQVPNYGNPKQGYKLHAGMCIAIEPMINLGSKEIFTAEDGWTILTTDGLVSAHFEHTIAIKEDGPHILSEVQGNG